MTIRHPHILAGMIKPIFGIAGANVAGQIVFILLSMIVTRFIGPADMGVFGQFLTLAACTSLIASLGMESTIVSAPTRHTALMLTGCVFYCSLIVGTILLSTYAFVQALLAPASMLDSGMILLAWAAIIIANAYSALQFLNARQCDYTALARGGFFNNALRGIGQVIGTASPLSGFHGLAAGETAARFAAIFTLARWKDILLALRLPLQFYARAGRRITLNVTQSLHFLSANILEAFLFWLPVVIFGHLYGLEVAGFVALTARLFSAPVQIVSRAIADVYHGQAQRLTHDHTQLRAITFTLWAGILGIAAFIPVVFWLLGERGFSFIFGPAWGHIAPIALAMSPLLATQLLAPVATRFSLVQNLVKIRLLYMIACIAVCGIFYVGGGIWFADARTGIAAYSLSIFFLCLAYLGYLARYFSPVAQSRDITGL